MAPASPTVAGWELARRLRQRRDELGIDVKAITERLSFTRNYWSAIEHERKIISVEKLEILLELFEFDDDEQRELLNLRETAKQRSWLSRYSALYSVELLRMFGLEQGAQAVRTYESLLVPGLLQSEEYARASMTSEINTIRQVEVDQRVEVRLRRQQLLDGDNPLHLTAVISEAVLRQQMGGPKVLHGQLLHLARMIKEHPDNLEVRVIPFAATACGIFGASTFHLFDFASPRLPAVAWQETVTAGGIIDDENQVRDLSLTYAEALGRTLSRKDTHDLILKCAREIASEA